MYSREKSSREEKVKKYPRNPSFSSSLLDEIYQSIDGDDDLRMYKEKDAKKHGGGVGGNGGLIAKTSVDEGEKKSSLRRACLIDKWMEMKIDDSARRRPASVLPEVEYRAIMGSFLHDNDPLFFSSGSNSSDSSSFGGFSSSETESFRAGRSSRTSCFTAPKPVRTRVPAAKQGKPESSELKIEDNLIKSKSRALKMYSSLKKMKQPISPGGRLTSFINSLFPAGNSKKSKAVANSVVGGYRVDSNSDFERNISSKSTQASTCSSASSFSRSCLSKASPQSRQKLYNGEKRTVKFYPVSVILDEDSRPCGHKSIYDQNSQKSGKPTEQETLNRRRVEESAGDFSDAVEEDDVGSDSSSDLFELDHLSLFGGGRYREELPVYETTYLGTNRAFVSGPIR